MKFFALFISALFISIPFYAMKIDTPITRPTHVAITEKGFVVGGSNGVAFFDHRANQWTHHQQDKKIDYLAASKKKIATSAKDLLTVYDIQTQEKAWEYNTLIPDSPITFDSQDDDQLITFLAPNRILLLKGPAVSDIKTYTAPKQYQPGTLISCHPQTTGIIYSGTTLSSYGKHGQKVSTVEIFYPTPEDALSVCNYTPDNATLARHTRSARFLSWIMSADARYAITHVIRSPKENNQLLLRDMSSSNTQYLLPDAPYAKTLFHPNNMIFVMLSPLITNHSFGYQLECWKCDDIISMPLDSPKKPIAICRLDTENKQSITASVSATATPLAISADGLLILIATHENCFLYRIPFETIAQTLYNQGTQEKCITTLTYLNNYKDNYIPTDITTIIVHYLLQLQLYKCPVD